MAARGVSVGGALGSASDMNSGLYQAERGSVLTARLRPTQCVSAVTNCDSGRFLETVCRLIFPPCYSQRTQLYCLQCRYLLNQLPCWGLDTVLLDLILVRAVRNGRDLPYWDVAYSRTAVLSFLFTMEMYWAKSSEIHRKSQEWVRDLLQ